MERTIYSCDICEKDIITYHSQNDIVNCQEYDGNNYNVLEQLNTDKCDAKHICIVCSDNIKEAMKNAVNEYIKSVNKG